MCVCEWYQVGEADRGPSWLPRCETWSEARPTRPDWPAVSCNTYLKKKKKTELCHVKRCYLQLSTRRGVMRDHTCVKTNTHILSARRLRRKREEVYSQAQNTGAELELHPHGLQHVSDELKLNTHTHTLKCNLLWNTVCHSPGKFQRNATYAHFLISFPHFPFL